MGKLTFMLSAFFERLIKHIEVNIFVIVHVGIHSDIILDDINISFMYISQTSN